MTISSILPDHATVAAYKEPAKVAIAAAVAIAVIVFSKLLGANNIASSFAGLAAGGAFYLLAQLDRLPWAKLRGGLSEKELMMARDIELFGREGQCVNPTGFDDKRSEARKASLEEFAKVATSPESWSQPEVQQAYGAYLEATLEEARGIIAQAREEYPDDFEAQAKYLSETEAYFEIFHAVRDAYRFAEEGRYCTDPSQWNDKSSWPTSAEPAEPLAQWEAMYSTFRDDVQSIIAHCESRVIAEWESPPTRNRN